MEEDTYKEIYKQGVDAGRLEIIEKAQQWVKDNRNNSEFKPRKIADRWGDEYTFGSEKDIFKELFKYLLEPIQDYSNNPFYNKGIDEGYKKANELIGVFKVFIKMLEDHGLYLCDKNGKVIFSEKQQNITK